MSLDNTRQSLLNSYKKNNFNIQGNSFDLKRLQECMLLIHKLLFPEMDLDKLNLDTLLDELIPLFSKLIEDAEKFNIDHQTLSSKNVVLEFLNELPKFRSLFFKDAEATYEGDPAAKSIGEIILLYPGFKAIVYHRIAHYFFVRGHSFMARAISEMAHSSTAIDIHPGATIGESFCIDHGTGIVIGETTIIGKYVKLYQGVTLGALSVADRTVIGKRHPTIEDHVIIYARATILGGNTIIGEHSVIGGNIWLVDSIKPHSRAMFCSKNSVKIIN